MSNVDTGRHQECMNRFIELANTMKDEGIDTKVVSSALMAGSAVYATFLFSGNEGGLTDSGVEKVNAAYKQHLERVQAMRKAESQQREAASDD